MKKSVFLAITAIACLTAQAANEYTKVTTTPADWTGTYLIVCESQGVIFNGGASEDDLDAKQGPAVLTNITFNKGVLEGTEAIDTAVFTIAETDDPDWPWSIQSYSGFYIGHKDTVDNGLSVEKKMKKKCKHTLTLNEGNLIATPYYEVSGEYNLQYNKKSDQMRFRYFVPNDKQAIQIYKLVTTPADVQDVFTSEPVAKKVIRDGKMVIIKNGQEFNILGF